MSGPAGCERTRAPAEPALGERRPGGTCARALPVLAGVGHAVGAPARCARGRRGDGGGPGFVAGHFLTLGRRHFVGWCPGSVRL